MHSRVPEQTVVWDKLHSRTFTPGSCHTGYSDWSNCQRCRLSLTRKRVAIIRRGGEPGHTRILFIGEAPGETEDKTGYPFVGTSGKILDTTISFVPYQFEYVITNAVGCRPVDIMYLDGDTDAPSEYNPEKQAESQASLKQLKMGLDYTLLNYNRDPTKAEINACSPHIEELLQSFRPQAVIFLGKTAASLLPIIPNKLKILTLLHPAFIARMEYKLLTVLKEARKIELLLHDLLS